MLSRDTRHDPDWRSQARCRDANPAVFFPTAESGPIFDAQVAAARAVCARCPVTGACLEYARDRLPHGIAAGLTPAERRRPTPRSGQRTTPTQPPTDGRRSELADAGRAALRAGRNPADVAREFGVTDRTVCRWTAANRVETSTESQTAGRGVG